jgi:predicted nuclease of predicted toxin-antitoxin system
VKFYLDEDLTPVVAVALRRRGVGAVSAHEVGQIGLSDAEQLAFAASQGRCLVSANARDFRRLGDAAIEQSRPHAGIVLCLPRIHGSDIGAVVRALVEIAKRYPKGLGGYDVLYLSRAQHIDVEAHWVATRRRVPA